MFRKVSQNKILSPTLYCARHVVIRTFCTLLTVRLDQIVVRDNRISVRLYRGLQDVSSLRRHR